MRSHTSPRHSAGLLGWSLLLWILVNAAVTVSAAKHQSTPPPDNSTTSSSSSTTTTTGDINGESYVLTTETYTATRKTFVRGPPPKDIAALAAAQIATTATGQPISPGTGPAAAAGQLQPTFAGQQQQQPVGMPSATQSGGNSGSSMPANANPSKATPTATTSSSGSSSTDGADQQDEGMLDYSFTAEVTGSPHQQQPSSTKPEAAMAPVASPPAPAPSTSSPAARNVAAAAPGTGASAAAKPIGTAAVSSTPSPGSKPAPAKPATTSVKPAGSTSATVKPGSNNATAAPGTGGSAAQKDKKWKPKYPFPQCLDNTLTYDVSFVGKLQFVQVGSVRYAYHRFGPLRPDLLKQLITNPPGGTLSSDIKRVPAPVVFLPGWGLTMYMWPIPLLQKLAETREVVIFDLMRTGLSIDNSTAPLSVPMMSNSTAALITKLGLKQPDIWSWSFGAFVGYGLLAFHQNKIGNVIIASGSPGGPEALLPPEPVTQQLASFEQNYTALLPYLFPGGAKDEGVCMFYAAYNSFYNSQFTQLQTPLGPKSLLQQSQAVVKFFQDPTIINRLSGTPNRVLILHGVQDRLMPVRNALLGAWKLLGAWMLQFPGEGHGIPFSNLQAVITTTMQFFSFANPLSREEMFQWSSYGSTAASRAKHENMTLVIRAEPIKR